MSVNHRSMDTQGVPNRDVNAAQRAATAVSLRARKLTFEQIASMCGYGSASSCRKAILREMNRVVISNVDDLRREELLILDRLHQECWEMALDKKNKGRLWAIDRLIQLSERRSKLMGLDQTPDMALMTSMVVVREVPSGYLAPVEATKP